MINAWTGEKYNNNNPSGIIILSTIKRKQQQHQQKKNTNELNLVRKQGKEHKIPKQADKRSLFAWEMRIFPAYYLFHIWLYLVGSKLCTVCTLCTYLTYESGTGFYAIHGYVRCALFYVLICVFVCVKIMPTTLYHIDRHTGSEIEIEFLTASKSFKTYENKTTNAQRITNDFGAFRTFFRIKFLFHLEI